MDRYSHRASLRIAIDTVNRFGGKYLPVETAQRACNLTNLEDWKNDIVRLGHNAG